MDMTSDEIKKRLSDNIKIERKKKNFTQEALAEKAQLSTQMINDIEGCRRWPSDNTISKIATALDIDVESLFINKSTSGNPSDFPYSDLKKVLIEAIDSFFG